MTATPLDVAEDDGKRLFGHPIGLTFLSMTEVWERFSFYGMSSLALLYMLDHLLKPAVEPTVLGLAGFRHLLEGLTGPLSPQAFASQTLGLFTGFVYFTPIFGGLLADRWLGKRMTVILGAVLLGLGNVAMAFDASYLLGLLLIILGTGCLKGNISTQVGKLYAPEDESRRTRGFVIFSASVNCGALLGPLFCGILAQAYGWHYGFVASALLMIVALATYIAGSKHLPPEDTKTRKAEHAPLSRRDVGTIAVLVGLMLFATLPLAAYYQELNIGLLFIDKSVDRSLFGWQVPAATFVSFDGFFGIVLVPVLIAIWKVLNRRGREPSDAGKVAIGCLIAAAASFTISIAAGRADHGEMVGIGWPIALFGINALGFLCYWPTLLAMFSRAAPPQVNSTVMGILFLSLFIGNIFVGNYAGFWEKWSHAAFFQINACIALAAFLIMLLIKPYLDRRLAPAD